MRQQMFRVARSSCCASRQPQSLIGLDSGQLCGVGARTTPARCNRRLHAAQRCQHSARHQAPGIASLEALPYCASVEVRYCAFLRVCAFVCPLCEPLDSLAAQRFFFEKTSDQARAAPFFVGNTFSMSFGEEFSDISEK